MTIKGAFQIYAIQHDLVMSNSICPQIIIMYTHVKKEQTRYEEFNQSAGNN